MVIVYLLNLRVLRRENNACILLVGLVVFTKLNFWKDNYTLIYFTIKYFIIKYVISSKFHRIISLQIVRKMKNTKTVQNTGHMHCPVLLSFLYRTKSQNTGLSGVISDTWQPYSNAIPGRYPDIPPRA